MITNWDIISQTSSVGNTFTLVTNGDERDLLLIERKLAGYVRPPKQAEPPFVYSFALPSNLDEQTLEKIRTAMREVALQSGKINEFAPSGSLGSPLFNNDSKPQDAQTETAKVELNPQDTFLNTPEPVQAAPLEEVFQDHSEQKNDLQNATSNTVQQETQKADSADLPFSDKDMLIKDMENTLLGQVQLEDIFSAETKYDMFLDMSEKEKAQLLQSQQKQKEQPQQPANDLEKGFNVFDQKIKDQTSIIDIEQLNALAENLSEQNAIEQEPSNTSPLLTDLSVHSIQPSTEETIRVDVAAHIPCPVPEETTLENTVPPAELITQRGQDNLPDITIRVKTPHTPDQEIQSLEKTFHLATTISTEEIRTQYEKTKHTFTQSLPKKTDEQVPPQPKEEAKDDALHEISFANEEDTSAELSNEESLAQQDIPHIEIPDNLDVTPEPIASVSAQEASSANTPSQSTQTKEKTEAIATAKPLQPQPTTPSTPPVTPQPVPTPTPLETAPSGKTILRMRTVTPQQPAQPVQSAPQPKSVAKPTVQPQVIAPQPVPAPAPLETAPSGKTILRMRTVMPQRPVQPVQPVPQPNSVVRPTVQPQVIAPQPVPAPTPLETAPSGKTILRMRAVAPQKPLVAPTPAVPTAPRTLIMPKPIAMPSSVIPPEAPQPVAPIAQPTVTPIAPVAVAQPVPPAISAAMPERPMFQPKEVSTEVPQEKDPKEKTKTIDYSIELPLSELKKHNWPLEVPLLPTYTLENLVLSVNRFAHATAISVLDNPGKMYNPLVFHGTTGTGKTHFLNAMAYGFSKKFGQESIFMTNGVRLSRGIQRYAMEGNMEKFEKFMDSVKVLLIDDIHLLAINEQNRVHISKLLNRFLKEQKQIVVTSKYPPESLSKLEDLISFRLDSGWISELKAASGQPLVRIIKTMLMGNGVDLNDAQITQFFEDTHMTLSAIKRTIRRLKVLENLIFPHIDESQRSQSTMLEKLFPITGEDTTSEILDKEPSSITSIETVGNGEWGRIGFFYPASNPHAMKWMVYALEQRAKELGINGGFDIAVRSSYSTENIISSAFKIANLCDNKKLHGAVILGPAVTVCEPSVRENFYDILTHMLEIMLIRCGIINHEELRLPSTYVKVIAELLR